LRGALLRPSDAAYKQALRVYNAMIEKRPALIAHYVDVADVIAVVNFAREHELTLAVRGGGHSGPGLGTCDNGLVIDLSGMKGIQVDPSARTARVEGGCIWGKVDHASHPLGLATPFIVTGTHLARRMIYTCASPERFVQSTRAANNVPWGLP
jgi:FAD/FMN-containing dehydrogenase